MATCKECLHYDVCERYGRTVDFPVDDGVCLDFADRSKYVVREKGEWVGWHGDRKVGEDEYGMDIYRHYHYHSCRKCGRRTAVKENFCPNCGADMRKGENDG